jgi:site-specific DNA-methyltransferase (adenine-specific)
MNNLHPAAFPVNLIARIISSTTGRVVLDPFMGSGTTAIAARAFERDYIGIDISPEYCAMAEERLDRDLVRREIMTAEQRSLLSVPNENLYKGRVN